jgi:DNA-binding NarL/FixJ family response regulator
MKSASRTIRFVLAESHLLLREGLKLLLAPEPGFHLVGEAVDGVAAVELIGKKIPDVLLLSLRLPGLEVIRKLRENGHTRVVVYSMEPNEWHLVQSLETMANAFLALDSSSAEMCEAIRAAACGGHFIAKSLRQKFSPAC